MHEGLGDLGALAHALGVALDRAVGVFESCRLAGGRGRWPRWPRGRPMPLSRAQLRMKLAPGHPFVEGVLLGAEADQAVQGRVIPGGLAEDEDIALAGLELAGGELEEGGLARSIGPEQAGDADGQRDGELVEPDHVAVPLGDVLEGDDGVAGCVCVTSAGPGF